MESASLLLLLLLRQWFVSAFSLLGKVMSSYLARGGSCWAGADRTGREGTVHADRYNGGPGHTSTYSCMYVDTQTHTPVCTFLTSRCHHPDGIPRNSCNRRKRGCADHKKNRDYARLLTSSFVSFVRWSSHRCNNTLEYGIEPTRPSRLTQFMSVWIQITRVDDWD